MNRWAQVGLILLQALIVFLFMSADIYFDWQMPGYSAGFLGMLLAYALTVWPLLALDALRRRRCDKRAGQRG